MNRISAEEARDYFKEQGILHNKLLQNIKNNLPELEALLEKISGHWYSEDHVYRLYHYSFKVAYAQDTIFQIREALKKIAPEGIKFNVDIEELFEEGLQKRNLTRGKVDNWFKFARPIIEAMFHAKYLLEMAIKYGKTYETAPDCLHNGWAALLYYYNMR